MSNGLKIGDYVMYIPNGLIFKVENEKQLKWMNSSCFYVKTNPPDGLLKNPDKVQLDT